MILRLSDPWQVQIAMLPLRSEAPRDEEDIPEYIRISMQKKEDNLQSITDALRDGACTYNDIMHDTGLCRRTLKIRLREMHAAGLVDSTTIKTVKHWSLK